MRKNIPPGLERLSKTLEFLVDNKNISGFQVVSRNKDFEYHKTGEDHNGEAIMIYFDDGIRVQIDVFSDVKHNLHFFLSHRESNDEHTVD